MGTKFYFRMATGLQGLNRIEDAQAAINSGLELDSKNGQLLQLNAELTSSAAPVAAAKPKKKKIVIEEVDSSKVEEAPAAPVVAAKPKKKKIAIEEVDSSKVEAPAAPVAAAKPKKKKIAIEEVDTSKPSAPVKAAVSEAPPKMPAALRAKLAPPRTGYEFERKISALKEASTICKYLDLLKVNTVTKLLSQDFSVEILMKVCQGLASSELEAGLVAHVKLLDALSKVNRFDIILDFLSSEEKLQVEATFAKLENVEGVDRVKQQYQL